MGSDSDSSQSGEVHEMALVWPAVQSLRHGFNQAQYLCLYPDARLLEELPCYHLAIRGHPYRYQLYLSFRYPAWRMSRMQVVNALKAS